MKKLLVVLAVLAGIVLSGCVGENDMAVIHISTLQQLQDMENDLYADYILDNDIDASATSGWNGGLGFDPVGSVPYFHGTFDGQGHKITNLFINRPGTGINGLFAHVDIDAPGGEVKNVILENVNITGLRQNGALAGIVYAGTISDCSSSGSVTGISWQNGGLIGQLFSDVQRCYSTCAVIGFDLTYDSDTGGLIGEIKGGSASDCYARGNATGQTKVGGFVGHINGGSISRCYSTGAVAGDSNVGGLVGSNEGTVNNSFWDIETSGQSSSDGGTGKITVEMKTKSTFTGWDFDTIWNICEGIYIPSYPWLRWQGIVGDICTSREAPWKEDILVGIEGTFEGDDWNGGFGMVKVEIPRRSGQWTTLGDVMRIHTSNGKNPFTAVEIGQAEVTCCNISKNFNSFEEASGWYKNLEGYATQIKLGCTIGGSPISVKLFTGIISAVDIDRKAQTAEIKLVDFLDYFGRVTIEETPVWENISLTQLFKNLVELAFPEWVHGVDYFVEDLGGSTIPAIGYTALNLLNELKMIAESRGKRLYTDVHGRLHCAAEPEGEPLTIKHDYNLEDVRERRDINSIINWVVVHARPHEVRSEPSTEPLPDVSVPIAEPDVYVPPATMEPDITPPGKVAGFTATPVDQQITLTWSIPLDSDYEGVQLCYHRSDYPLNHSSLIPLHYVDKDFSPNNEYVHTGRINGKRYYYSAFTKDSNGNYSEAAHASAIAGAGQSSGSDSTATSRVSAFRVEPGSGRVILTWVNPGIANFDLVRIRRSTSSYPPSETSGSAVYEGTAETTTDTGLNNGQKYYYSAFVKNTGGIWSGAAYASATPGGLRKTLSTQIISGSGNLGPQTGAYGSSYFKKIKLTFRGIRGIYSGWLRFKHEWDIKISSGPKYKSNERHEYGQADDLQIGFSQNIGGVVAVTVTKIAVTAAEVRIEYKLVYTGGKALSISFRNKLSLRG